jgi:HAMP domain-containing protein
MAWDKRWLGTSRWIAAKPLAVLLDYVVAAERARIAAWLRAGPPFADRHALADALDRGDDITPTPKEKPTEVSLSSRADEEHVFETRTPEGHIIFLCKHCGAEKLVTLPQPAQNVIDLGERFAANHRKCPKTRKRKL